MTSHLITVTLIVMSSIKRTIKTLGYRLYGDEVPYYERQFPTSHSNERPFLTGYLHKKLNKRHENMPLLDKG